MEFSWNYQDVMRRLVTEEPYYLSGSDIDAREALAYAAMLKFDIKGEGCEVPTSLISKITSYIPTIQEEAATIVMPLFIGRYTRTVSGVDTMLKYFVRDNNGRLNKATTPKGETYYGTDGIILDKDFNPLFISTALVHYAPSEQRLVIDGYKIHLHPNVFTDDTKIVNKSLAKKGVAYYLTYSVNQWRSPDLKYKVEIDDCSQFIVKAHRPSVNHCSSEDFNKVLRNNIDEVLRQIADDNRRNF